MSETIAAARAALARRGRKLEYFTIAWNAVEGLVGREGGGRELFTRARASAKE